jgi:pyruvate/oxaloacetate carboxyltransferase
MNDIHIIDTTLRDGQLSLWALGMKTGAMLAIAEQMDRCGFESMEFFGFAGYIKYVKEHKENPWDWMGPGARKFRRTRLRYHGGLASGFEKIPRSVRLLMVERVIARGITLTRSSDPWNDYGAAAVEIDALKKLGMDVIVNVIYSVSPRHTDEYYAERARHAAVNVITGERYKEVTDQSIQYALGHWGKEAPQVMDADVKDNILSRPRASEWANWMPPDLSLEEVRQKFGAPKISDDELVLRVIAGGQAVDAMLAAGAPKEYLSVRQPLVQLIGELARRRDCRQIYIQKDGLRLRMETKTRTRRV